MSFSSDIKQELNKNSIRPCKERGFFLFPSKVFSIPKIKTISTQKGEEDRPQNLSSSFPLSFQNPWKRAILRFSYFFSKGKMREGEGERGRGSNKLNVLWNFVIIHSDFGEGGEGWGKGRIRQERKWKFDRERKSNLQWQRFGRDMVEVQVALGSYCTERMKIRRWSCIQSIA